ncbi:class II aaRS and biotin synthetase [Neoconidiobolus thromboides FSU 785]|nr:class II aaRS and biotin synthetase [Neoconidiobolus thromboides FSU 785]
MDILVYNGPGTSPGFVIQTINYLKRLMNENYAIRSIDDKALINEPWQLNCKLLVIGGGRDIPYLEKLEGKGNLKIQNYVYNGGNYWGICAGAYYASKRVEFELGTNIQVIGNRELQFFPGTCQGTTFPGFQYESEIGAKAVDIKFIKEDIITKVYYNGGGTFLNATEFKNVKVLAQYNDILDKDKNSAIILCNVGKGKALLSAVHPEYLPLEKNEISQQINNEELNKLMINIFKDINLLINNNNNNNMEIDITPLYMFNFEEQIELKLKSKLNSTNKLLEDNKDTFEINSNQFTNNKHHLKLIINKDINEINNQLNNNNNNNNKFNIIEYYKHYNEQFPKIIKDNKLLDENNNKIQFGYKMIFTPVITSTQRILNDNIKFQSCLDDGTLCLALTQISGKGRGKNVWVSPSGCLQFSIYFQHNNSIKCSAILLQYLFGIAVIEGIKSIEGYKNLDIYLKWPNDIYAKNKLGELKKIGGILVNSSYSNKNFNIVIGCGLNVNNRTPTYCINSLIEDYNELNNTNLNLLTMEQILPNILIQFQKLYQLFLISKNGMEPFKQLYYKYWLHSNKIITLKDQDNIKCQIVGITMDYGELKVISLDPITNSINPLNYQTFLLQPDGNSFDIMNGLISKKILN